MLNRKFVKSNFISISSINLFPQIDVLLCVHRVRNLQIELVKLKLNFSLSQINHGTWEEVESGNVNFWFLLTHDFSEQKIMPALSKRGLSGVIAVFLQLMSEMEIDSVKMVLLIS